MPSFWATLNTGRQKNSSCADAGPLDGFEDPPHLTGTDSDSASVLSDGDLPDLADQDSDDEVDPPKTYRNPEDLPDLTQSDQDSDNGLDTARTYRNTLAEIEAEFTAPVQDPR